MNKFRIRDYMIAPKTASSAETDYYSVHDITKNTLPITHEPRDSTKIALDRVDRDLHEPSLSEIAKFYGLDLKDVIQEGHDE